MTPREHRLRQRIDELLDRIENLESQLARALTPRREPWGRCVYCGRNCYGKACGQHKDLLMIEAGQA